MTSLVEHLSSYATYHRDRRNIATHFVGVPMIVVGVEALLARASVSGVSLALVASLGAAAFYLRLERRLGAVMSVLLAFALVAGSAIASQGLATWLGLALGLFGVGWVIQFVGHVYEGRKPAFVDDLVGLLVGPLFVTAEVGFALGLRGELRAEIERRAGPTRGASRGATSSEA